MTPTGFDIDVAIVGYGPVGQALAALLGRAGHRVAVFERFREIYRLPRAVHLDHEIMRLLQSLGLSEVLADEMVPVDDYRWFGADGELLLRFEPRSPAPSGWEGDYMFFQPELERAIDDHACVPAGVTVERGWAAEGLEQADERVELTLRRVTEDEPGRLALTGEARTVNARWVVGADGANSFVREACGITRRDLGFQERWLVVDAEPHDMAALAHLPIASQYCDPSRPTTIVQSGPRHRRWEFMLLPDEQAADFEDPERVWALLEPWYRPQDGPLTRSAVYEFRSMLAERDAQRPRAAGGRCGAPDPAVSRSGAVLGRAGCGQPGVEARPRAARPGTDAAAGHDRSRAPAPERGDHPPGHRARQGAMPAGPAGGRRTGRDAAPGRVAAAARTAAAERRRATPPGRRHLGPAGGRTERPGSGAPRLDTRGDSTTSSGAAFSSSSSLATHSPSCRAISVR